MPSRLTLPELPAPARAVAGAVTDAVDAARNGEAGAFGEAAGQLLAGDVEHVRVLVGDVVRMLLEEIHPDGVDADDLHALIAGCLRDSAWFADVDAAALVVVIGGALGVHPDLDPAPADDDGAPREEVAPRPPPESVIRHALLLTADLLRTRGRPPRPYLEAAYTEIARRETVEQP
jgi:hypothetical protein